MSQRSATEVTTKIATTVDELMDAWTFIMAHMNEVGDSPSVTITPCWSSDNDFQTRYFEVSVSGMIEYNSKE